MKPKSHPAFRKRGTLPQKYYDRLEKQIDEQSTKAENDEAEERTQRWLKELDLDR